MTERFDLSVVIIYCAKQWEGTPSVAALSIISCAIASIEAKSFTGDGLSSTKEREAEARRYASVLPATVGQTIAINGPRYRMRTRCRRSGGRPAQFDLAASRRNAIRSASFGMLLNHRVPSRVACSSNQPRAGSCLAVVKLEQLS